MREAILLAMSCALLTGCATSSAEIGPQYVSPIAYQSFTCSQIAEEAQRVSGRAAQLAGVQDSKATNDQVAMGVGLILFWPSLLFVKGDGQTAAELARLKGEYDALEQESIRKNCGIRFEHGPPPPPPTDTGSIPKPLQ